MIRGHARVASSLGHKARFLAWEAGDARLRHHPSGTRAEYQAPGFVLGAEDVSALPRGGPN